MLRKIQSEQKKKKKFSGVREKWCSCHESNRKYLEETIEGEVIFMIKFIIRIIHFNEIQ